jgi:hypothetical protein
MTDGSNAPFGKMPTGKPSCSIAHPANNHDKNHIRPDFIKKHPHMKTIIQLALGILATVAAPALQSQVACYNFDVIYEIGDEFWVPNTGSGGDTINDINSLDIRMFGVNGRKASLATAPGVGGNGSALDLTCNLPGMANAAAAAQHVASVGALDALTVTGWMKVTVPFIKETTLVRSFAHNRQTPGSGDGFWIVTSGTDELSLRLGRDSASGKIVAPYHGFASLDKWVFFAVTWDNTEGTVQWFYGDESTPSIPVLAPAKNILAGQTLKCPKSITLGRGSASSVGLGGYIDEIRIFDKALPQSEIEKVRLDALTQKIP